MTLRGYDSASESHESPGIHRGGDGKFSAVEDFARRGACPPLGYGPGMAPPPREFAAPTTTSAFHTLVCRRHPG